MKILHLYPNLMNLYGDYANVTVLCKHLKDQGLIVEVDKKDLEDTIDIKQYDFIYMGSGTESNQKIALHNLKNYKNDLVKYIEAGKTLLFTGNAMELLGKKINDEQALGFLDFTVEETNKRYTGDVIVNNNELGTVVGFINKSSIIKGGQDCKLFDYEFTDSNLIDNNYEGYRYKNAFGTHIIGPVLVKNPSFMRKIITCMIPNDFIYKDILYPYEEESYNITLNALRGRK